MSIFLKICAAASAMLAAACSEPRDRPDGAVSETVATSAPSAETEAWLAAKSAGSLESYANFLEAYPESDLAAEALRQRRILELDPIKLNVEVAAPEGTYMKSAPPVLKSDGTIAASQEIQSAPEGTTMKLDFSAVVDGEEITESIQATFDSVTDDGMIFRNDDGLCILRSSKTPSIKYCAGEAPPPPDPDDVRGLMAYAWLALP